MLVYRSFPREHRRLGRLLSNDGVRLSLEPHGPDRAYMRVYQPCWGQVVMQSGAGTEEASVLLGETQIGSMIRRINTKGWLIWIFFAYVSSQIASLAGLSISLVIRGVHPQGLLLLRNYLEYYLNRVTASRVGFRKLRSTQPTNHTRCSFLVKEVGVALWVNSQ